MKSGSNDTIVAPATGRGGAIGVIRLSGEDAIALVDGVFKGRVCLCDVAGNTVHFGAIVDGGEIVDQVLATVFRAPKSYTGEDVVEISCHGSGYVESRIVQLLIARGARAAGPGEFTVRAFLAGKLDLAQAEAVADLIASSGRAQHALAMGQLRGGVSSALAELRGELTELAALLELELDFGEEDVEFASRDKLDSLASKISGELASLSSTFSLGNAIREGVPVAIVGRPNAGKSTLLNALVGDERALTSDIAGTTRDRIEEQMVVGGINFRFIDTAGLRSTDDPLERMGIDRARDAIRRAHIVLLVVDASSCGASQEEVEAQAADLDLTSDQRLCVVYNKADKIMPSESPQPSARGSVEANLSFAEPQCRSRISISARTGAGLDDLRAWIAGVVDVSQLEAGAAIVSGARHFEALTLASKALERVREGLRVGLSADLLAEDVRESLHHLGTITGAVTTTDILTTIFSKFCIGK